MPKKATTSVKPKRSLSAFLLFSQDNRKRIVANNPKATFGQVGKLLGEAWTSTPDNKKKQYQIEAARLKVKYDKEMENYQPESETGSEYSDYSGSDYTESDSDSEQMKRPARKSVKKTNDKPKRTPSAFILFSQDNREKIKAKNPNATFGQLGKLLGEAWANASDSTKKKYLDEAARLKENAK